MEETLNELQIRIKDTEEEAIIIGGDLNARTANKGTNNWTDSEENENARKSKDQIMDKTGKRLITEIEDKGWIMLNGNWKGDEEGEFTYISTQGQSVIDYGIINFQAEQEVEYFKIEERTESDYLPITIKLNIDYRE